MPECTTCARAPYNKDSHVCQRCFDYTPLGKPVYKHWARALPTNADRIRSMSDEELAEWISSIFDCHYDTSMCADFCNHNCDERNLTWLRQPAEE